MSNVFVSLVARLQYIYIYNAITDLRTHETNRKVVLHKLSFINSETYNKEL